jgi:hypothetical protein
MRVYAKRYRKNMTFCFFVHSAFYPFSGLAILGAWQGRQVRLFLKKVAI